MEIFSVRQQAISENDLGADTALFIRLAGTLGTDKLIVHCDYLSVDDSLTEGTPRKHNITCAVLNWIVDVDTSHTQCDRSCPLCGLKCQSWHHPRLQCWNREYNWGRSPPYIKTSYYLQSLVTQLRLDLVAVLTERVALVDVELEIEDGSAAVTLETFPVVTFTPGWHTTWTNRLKAGEAGT